MIRDVLTDSGSLLRHDAKSDVMEHENELYILIQLSLKTKKKEKENVLWASVFIFIIASLTTDFMVLLI